MRSELEPATLELHAVIESEEHAIERVFFPDSGVLSVSSAVDGRGVCVALIGLEGMTGVTLMMSNDHPQQKTQVLIAGAGQSIPAATLRSLAEASPSLRLSLLRYAHFMYDQIASFSAGNVSSITRQRLAKILLMILDRVEGAQLPIHQSVLATMLGVHQPSISGAIHVLEAGGALRAERRHVIILDRHALCNVAGVVPVASR